VTGTLALGMLVGYLIAAIPFGLLAGLAKGVDVRKSGSGNIGATNVIRVVGVKMGLLVFVLDVLKGLAAVMICRALGAEGWVVVTAGLLAVIGHSFSPYLLFKGGKGVATALGVLIGLHPLTAGICCGLWVLLVVITRYVSLSSVAAVAAAPVSMYLLMPAPDNVVAAVAITPVILLIIGRHAENIERLLNGTENRVGSTSAKTDDTDAPGDDDQE